MSAVFIVFDPEAAGESITYATEWKPEWEDAWEGGHIEIIDAYRTDEPRRYIGQGSWEKLSHV